jgi:hypothetical protein
MLFCIIGHVVEHDLFFMSATGREILQNGIPYTNVWSMDHSAEFVAQQWLYCVIIALLEPLGIWSLKLLVLITILILSVLIWKLMVIRGCNNRMVYGLTMTGIALTCGYLYSARPESITIILLLLEAYGLEKYRATSKYGWLSLLPVTMVLEMNLHASMWIMHFGVVLIYMLPSGFSVIKKDYMLKQWKPVSIFTLLSIGCMFINPYGSDGVMYLFRSFSAGTFNLVPIKEVQPVTLFSSCMMAIALLCIMLVILLVAKKCDSVTFYTGIFIILLEFISVRNNMFHCIGLLYLATGLYNAYKTSSFQINWKKDVRNYLWFIFAPLSLFVVLFCVISSVQVVNDMRFASQYEHNYVVRSEVDDSASLMDFGKYINDNGLESSTVFSGFNTGSYLEYIGCTNVFIDCRPEIYTYELNKSNHYLKEYSALCGTSSYYTLRHELGLGNTAYIDFARKFTDVRNFDYIVIDRMSCEQAYELYVSSRWDYTLMPEYTNDGLAVYQHVMK